MSPWVKLDDGMGEHRKTIRTLRAGGLGAFGMHALGVLHAAKYLTDGFVEDEFVEETFDTAKTRPAERARVLEALASRGLWVRDEGRGGWLIHDYLEYNPTRAKVEAQRRADAERKAKGRDAMSTQKLRGVRAVSGRTDDGFRGESVRPVPSRPDLTTPLTPQGGNLAVPVLPVGKRGRELAVFDGEVRAYAAAEFPELGEQGVFFGADPVEALTLSL